MDTDTRSLEKAYEADQDKLTAIRLARELVRKNRIRDLVNLIIKYPYELEFKTALVGCGPLADYTKKYKSSMLKTYGRINSCKFSHDSKEIIVGSEDGYIYIFDVTSEKIIKTIKAYDYTCSVTECMFSPDKKLIMTAPDFPGYRNGVKIFDANTGKLINTFVDDDRHLYSYNFSPDGSQIVSCYSSSSGNGIIVFDATAGNKLNDICSRDIFKSCEYSPDGSTIVSVSEHNSNNRRIDFWDSITLDHIKTFSNAEFFGECHYSPDGECLVSTNIDPDDGRLNNIIKIWDIKTGLCNRRFRYRNEDGHADDVKFSPDGLFIISNHRYGKTKIWDASTGKCIKTLTRDHRRWIDNRNLQGIYSSDISIDGSLFVSSNEHSTILYRFPSLID